MYRWQLIRFLVTLAVICAVITLSGCDDDFTPTGSPESVLRRPSSPVPVDGSTDLSVVAALSWSKCNPTDSSVRYALYFCGQNDWSLLADSLVDTTYSLPALGTETDYYWRVEAVNSAGACSKSSIWSFSTGDDWAYPLSDGNRWEYQVTSTYSNFDPESLAQGFSDPVVWYRDVRIDGTYTEADSSVSFVLRESRPDRVAWTEAYFQNRSDGMYYWSGILVGLIMPYKIPAEQTIVREGPDLLSETEQPFFLSGGVVGSPVAKGSNSITSQKCLEYPLEVGSQWTYVVEENNVLGVRIGKKVVARTTIEVPAGSFDCFCIEWLRDADGDGQWDDDIEWYDYVSERGLIRRRMISRGVYLTNYVDDGEPLHGTADVEIDYVLIDYDLNSL